MFQSSPSSVSVIMEREQISGSMKLETEIPETLA
jgi:hypothetical protein